MKRLGRILKWIGICAGVAITILLVSNAYFVWSTGTRLERRLRALREAGEPVLLADLSRAPIAPEKNADVFLRRAANDLDAIQKDLQAWYPKTGYPTGQLSPADRERLEKLFAAYPRVMPLLEQAANCPDSDPQLDGTLPTTQFLGPFMEHSTKHRVLTRVLRTRTVLLQSEGRADQALATQVLVLKMTRHWRREPLIIGYLVTAVCEQVAMESVNQVLQAGPVSSSAREALDAELALHDTMEGYIWALRSERCYSLSSLREMPGFGFWLTRGFVNDLMLRFVELYDRYLEKAARPYADEVSDKSASTPSGRPNLYGALVTLLEPALAAARESAERVRAMSRTLRVLGALQVQVPSSIDQTPNLTELGLPPDVTIDPFSGKPLHVKKLPQGWMVYSVGSNLVDDGGKPEGKSDIGVGPISTGEPQKKP